MIGKKKLSEIRASVRAHLGKDVVNTLDKRLQRLKRRPTADPLEIETLKLLRDGLRSEPKRKPRKRARAS